MSSPGTCISPDNCDSCAPYFYNNGPICSGDTYQMIKLNSREILFFSNIILSLAYLICFLRTTNTYKCHCFTTSEMPFLFSKCLVSPYTLVLVVLVRCFDLYNNMHSTPTVSIDRWITVIFFV